MSESHSKNPGLYIHIPFCRSKCPYCGFYSVSSMTFLQRWLDTLDKEIDCYKENFDAFDTLYLGGGTPTALEVSDIERILDRLVKKFRFKDDTEKTIEANPGDLTLEKIKGLKKLDFNRINLGVQSFNDRDLAFLGRRHTAIEAEEAIMNLRLSGFNNIGIDLIYGTMNQSIKDWEKNLKRAIEFSPEHVSCYQLSFEKGTPFWTKKETGKISTLNEEKGREFFLMTSNFLKDHGYIHYEISNFAKEMLYYSRHNWKYWVHTPYLGLGPSAHSYQDSTRWWNFRSIEKYCAAIERGEKPVEEFEDLSPEQTQLEAISLGLRTKDGFDLKYLNGMLGPKNKISGLEHAGLIQIKDGMVVPTIKGFLVADKLPLYLYE